MKERILDFRNACAEDGIELTPKEAEKMFKAYLSLRKEIIKAVKDIPNFYLEICNRTTEDKLRDIAMMQKKGESITLKEYNELQATIKKICEMEGYDS